MGMFCNKLSFKAFIYDSSFKIYDLIKYTCIEGKFVADKLMILHQIFLYRLVMVLYNGVCGHDFHVLILVNFMMSFAVCSVCA